jgi:ATP-dependent Lhr-like helicase
VARGRATPSETERRAALARSLLERHGVLTREAVASEAIAGGFSAVYDVLKALEDRGQVRRGYFVAGLGATQFAVPGADDALRAQRDRGGNADTVVLAATDPANAFGAALPWPEVEAPAASRPQRAAGALVVLQDGRLLGFLARSEHDVLTFFRREPAGARDEDAAALARTLASLVDRGSRLTLLVERIDGEDASVSSFAPALEAVGFVRMSKGLLARRGSAGRDERSVPTEGWSARTR